MGNVEVLRAASNLPARLLEMEELHSELASRLPTSLPPAALLAIKQNLAAQGRKQPQPQSEPTRDKAQHAARADATPSTPKPGLELPLLRTHSTSDVPAVMCPPGMQPVTPRGLCEPPGQEPFAHQAHSCCKACAATAGASTAAIAGIPLVFLLLLLASLHAIVGLPADGFSPSPLAACCPSGALRKWWMACSCASAMLLLLTQAMYTKLGWRAGAVTDLLWLTLRAGTTCSLPVFMHSAAGLLACRMLAGCALARRKPWKGTTVHLPKEPVRHWHKA